MQFGRKDVFNLNPTVKYDGFFESEIIPSYLGLMHNEVCVDFYGSKRNNDGLRYWLTREIRDYKIAKSFALDFKPYEFNVFEDNAGSELFLYDTTETVKNEYKANKDSFFSYVHQFRSVNSALMQSIKAKLNK